MSATIHFMHGFIGYGKSTFARKLAEKLKCKRISIDDVYSELNEGRAAIGLSKEERAEILKITRERIAEEINNGKDVIFDSGSWSRENRDSNRSWAKSLGAQCKYYSLDCTPEIAWERVLKRNQNKVNENQYPKSHFDEKFKQFQQMEDNEEFELVKSDYIESNNIDENKCRSNSINTGR